MDTVRWPHGGDAIRYRRRSLVNKIISLSYTPDATFSLQIRAMRGFGSQSRASFRGRDLIVGVVGQDGIARKKYLGVDGFLQKFVG
ncbi:hypothetical protein ASPFODRAFT_53878 [Aspergillus luchuensis CBS 106.47]|uniref:Uncharacterized protein n=1 Tax=Aspergillus luchuensis (strain CBS 106.47) TaxID=1137211 RepID=A0A1M3T067_ASPLC|nr:hypothetical protein ASPFODRAFT_53878 [Aspergillus luchuensis CBS 106.47]